MASILVVCTGNVCRSPVAEGLLRSALEDRFGDLAPSVASAGTMGWEGEPAQRGSVVAAAALGIDIAGHRGRLLRRDEAEEASLVLAMAREHREAVVALAPAAAERTFTLKELVRLLEGLPPAVDDGDPGARLGSRVAQASELRRSAFPGNPYDEDVADPLGMPAIVYEAVAGELAEWVGRLAEGLFGRAHARAAAEGE
jgi:protein-tyrosine phosphatase